MAKNKMEHVRDHLFLALERLNDDDCSGEKLTEEVEKAKAIANIGSVLIQSAKIEIDYLKQTGQLNSNSELFKSVKSNSLIE